MRPRKKNKLVLLAAAALVVLLASVAGFFFWKWQALKSDANVSAQQSSQRIIEKVGQLFALPTGEEPTVALIQDKEKLQSQDFFKNARNGDYLLMYSKSKIALIYREKDDKLINVGPIAIDDKKSKNQGSSDVSQSPSGTAQESPSRQP